MRGNACGLEWLECFAAFWSAQTVVVGVFDGMVAFSVALGLSSLLRLVSPWMLIGRQIPMRRHLPQAILTAEVQGVVTPGSQLPPLPTRVSRRPRASR